MLYEGEWLVVQGGSNMTRTNCDLFTHKSSRSYLNHLVVTSPEVNISQFPSYRNTLDNGDHRYSKDGRHSSEWRQRVSDL
jgi:hypothetical protein